MAVGTERLSFIAWASIAAGPRRGTTAPPSGAAGPGEAGPSPFAAASTSAFVTFPPGAEPRIAPRSTPLAAATRRATGEARVPSVAPAAGAGSGSGGFGRRRRAIGRRAGARGHLRQHLADLHRLVGLGQDPGDRATRRGRHLGVDLVGRDLDHRLALRNRIALLLVPFEDRALGDGFAHLGHRDLNNSPESGITPPEASPSAAFPAGSGSDVAAGTSAATAASPLAPAGLTLGRLRIPGPPATRLQPYLPAVCRAAPSSDGSALGSSSARVAPTSIVSSGALRISGDHARGRGRDLGVDLVGRDLDDGLALVDEIALLLVPFEDRALGDRLAHLGHLDLDRARHLAT